MKKRSRVLVSCAVLVLTLGTLASANDGEMIGWVNDIEQAKAEAKEQGRPMIIFVTMNGCYYCTQMKKTTLVDPGLVDDVEENFVPAYINMAQNRAWVERLGIRSFPTTLLATPDGKIKEFVRGFVGARDLREKMEKIRELN